jgi:hypothetical protein
MRRSFELLPDTMKVWAENENNWIRRTINVRQSSTLSWIYPKTHRLFYPVMSVYCHFVTLFSFEHSALYLVVAS